MMKLLAVRLARTIRQPKVSNTRRTFSATGRQKIRNLFPRSSRIQRSHLTVSRSRLYWLGVGGFSGISFAVLALIFLPKELRSYYGYIAPRFGHLQCDSAENASGWTSKDPKSSGRGDGDFQGKTPGRRKRVSANDHPPILKKDVSALQQEADVDGSGDAWVGFTDSLSTAGRAISGLGDKITDFLVPDWFTLLPGFIAKLQAEMSTAPGSLSEQIWYEANDPEINPEIIWDAAVRVSNDLCDEEKFFLQHRRVYTRQALARYLDLGEEEIHLDDVPVIAMCGSGGGLRALVAGSSSYLSAHESGLFDCVTYTAGVSGSCWLQTLYYSTIGKQSHDDILRHLKNRLGVHIAFPPTALSLLSSAPTNKYLLSGFVEKLKGLPNADCGLVDVYGLLLAGRLLVPKGELAIDEEDLKVSKQRRYTDSGAHPLPIYTAVRHEIPLEEIADQNLEAVEEKARKEAWFQWFEWTPYEFWCEEFQAGIPTWAIGRKFSSGRSVFRENGLALPELRVPLLMGIWGSAFCATLSHYYREVRPLLKSLTGFGGIDQLISERDEDLIKVHPIDPALIPNFVLGMQHQLPPSCPESVFRQDNLQLMDAGMSNNLPIYPLLRPGRNVDILIAFDASADVKTDNWLRVVDGYARQRGIKGWPIGAGWPPADRSLNKLEQDLEKVEAHTGAEANAKLEEAMNKDSAANLSPSPSKSRSSPASTSTEIPSTNSTSQRQPFSSDSNSSHPAKKDSAHAEADYTTLGPCTIWVGSTVERSYQDPPPPPKRVASPTDLQRADAGITVIYFPLIPNPSAATPSSTSLPPPDPQTTPYLSTWNFVYTPEQVDAVVGLARANFGEGAERTRRCVRAVYERKRADRLCKEAEEIEVRRRWRLRAGGGVGRHSGDLFS